MGQPDRQVQSRKMSFLIRPSRSDAPVHWRMAQRLATLVGMRTQAETVESFLDPRNPTHPRLVVIESPFAGEIERNIRYARAAMNDSLSRGEAPFASHLLYTQPGILDDSLPSARARGIEAGFLWGRIASLTAVYTNLGLSAGMRLGIERAEKDGREIEYRKIDGWL